MVDVQIGAVSISSRIQELAEIEQPMGKERRPYKSRLARLTIIQVRSYGICVILS